MEEDKDLCKKCVHFWIDFPIINHEPVYVAHCEILDNISTRKYLDEEVEYPCLECPFGSFKNKEE